MINFEGSCEVDPGWPCPTCTLFNSSTISVCSACSAKKDGASDGEISQQSPTASPKRTMQRQKSIPVESRRMRDEKQAKEQWINIVQYCNDVCIIVQLSTFCDVNSLNHKIYLLMTYFNWDVKWQRIHERSDRSSH